MTDACSYLYGEQSVARSYRRLVAAFDLVAAKTAPWWLDVELTLSWAGTYQLNIAALQGFIAGLHNAGASGPIGIYSTSAQWKDITGLTALTTPTAFNGQLPDWWPEPRQHSRRRCRPARAVASPVSRRRSRSTGSARSTPTCAVLAKRRNV